MSGPSSRGLTVWLTGLPGSGKTTSAQYLTDRLESMGIATASLDGDVMRGGISADLGFTDADRDENVRRAGEIAILLAEQGSVVAVSLVSPRRQARDAVRARHATWRIGFLEVHVAAPLVICELRDPKSLYRRAREGTLDHMTGITDPYEPPLAPELVLSTDKFGEVETGELLVDTVLGVLKDR